MTKFLVDILNEPDELLKSLAYTMGPGRSALDEASALVRSAPRLYLTGIGSSWHAGLGIATLLEAAGCAVCVIDTSEMLHFAETPPGSVVIAMSRSGRSTEIVQLVDKLRGRARIVAITNTPDSPLVRGADILLRMETAFDHMVSVTMYSALCLVGGLLARAVARSLNGAAARALEQAIHAAKRALPAWQECVANNGWFTAEAPVYFLARGTSLASCHEARLLWEEAAKAPATAMTVGGFRHGSQEMLREGMRIGLWLDPDHMRSEDLALAADLRKLGVKVMFIGQDLPDGAADLALALPPVAQPWQFVIDIIPAQLAAERQSHVRGVSCDDFRLCPYIVEDQGGLFAAG